MVNAPASSMQPGGGGGSGGGGSGVGHAGPVAAASNNNAALDRVSLLTLNAKKAPPMKYASSWAEDVQQYHAAKAILPWAPGDQTPIKHVTRYEKSREEREYDVVLGKFREAEKEVARRNRDQQQKEYMLEHGRAKQLRNVERFHLINHSPMFRGAQDPKERKAAANGNGQPRRKHGAQYYIISNEAYADAPQPSVTKVPRSPPKHVSRDFNILTNKFHDRHDERFEAEHAHAKDVAAVKFFKTHDYDAVRGRYFDDSKEIEFVDKRKAEQQAHGKDRVFSLPPREQFSEGRLYNILNQQVINPDKLDTVKEKSQRALNKIQKTAFEQRMRQLGEFEMNRTEELCLNRFANQRQAQMYIHGYDPISNQSYIGRNAKQIPPIRADATKNAWEVLTKSVEKSQQRAITAAPTPREGGIGANSVKTPNGHKIQVHKPNVLVVDQLATTSDSISNQSGFQRDNTTFRPVRTGGFPTISHA